LDQLSRSNAQNLGYILLPFGLALAALTYFGFRSALPAMRRDKSREYNRSLRDELRDKFKKFRR
jgi:hypothetical protein